LLPVHLVNQSVGSSQRRDTSRAPQGGRALNSQAGAKSGKAKAREGNWIRQSLDPLSRLSEIMFGLLMTLTFTGTMSVALGAEQTVRSVLAAALGCNIAWGLVDAVMYLLTTSAEQGRQTALMGQLRAATPARKEELVRHYLSGGAGERLSREEALTIAAILERVDDGAPAKSLKRQDFVAAMAVFILVVASTFPPIIPFLFMDDVWLAMRLSNAIALVMLFAIGVGLDRHVNGGSRIMRWIVPMIGSGLVVTTIMLGG
jgi:VIT1/CCC1 family predicted Fe2+/Mn2+ transporter